MLPRAALIPATALLITLAPSPARAEEAPADPDPWLGPDKALHFSLSAAITGGGYAIGSLLHPDPGNRAAFAASIGVGAGLAKEVFDSLGYGTPSWKDFLWDVLGVSVGIGISISLDYGIRAYGPRSTALPAR